MTTREKRLATAIGVVAAVGVVMRVVYPMAIKPLVDVDDEIADQQQALFELEEERDQIIEVLSNYKKLLTRTGSTDALKVRNAVQERLETMLRVAGLESLASKITPKRPVRERDTGLYTIRFTITAEGKLRQVIQFLEKSYELPYVARFRDIEITPVTTKRVRGKKPDDQVKLTATYEVKVLPRHEFAEGMIDFDALEQPFEVIKHAGEAYAMIWDRRPFQEYVAPPPPRPVRQEEPPKTPVKKPTRPEPPQPPPKPVDRDRADKVVAAVLRLPSHELVIKNTKRRTQEYVAQGQELDGGTLVYVHPYGGVVRKDEGELLFYPLGKRLTEAVPADEVPDYPGLDEVTQQLAMGTDGQTKPDAPPELLRPPADQAEASAEDGPPLPEGADDEVGAADETEAEEAPPAANRDTGNRSVRPTRRARSRSTRPTARPVRRPHSGTRR